MASNSLTPAQPNGLEIEAAQQTSAQNAADNVAAAKEQAARQAQLGVEREYKHSETVPGGHYIVNGVSVDANGKVIEVAQSAEAEAQTRA